MPHLRACAGACVLKLSSKEYWLTQQLHWNLTTPPPPIFSICLCHLSLPPSASLFYSLPGSSAEASTITATSTCLLTVSNGDRRLRRREGEDSGCTPATMGENCHNDRGGDREMKGSGGGTGVEGGAGEGDVVWKEGWAKIKRELKRGR